MKSWSDLESYGAQPNQSQTKPNQETKLNQKGTNCNQTQPGNQTETSFNKETKLNSKETNYILYNQTQLQLNWTEQNRLEASLSL